MSFFPVLSGTPRRPPVVEESAHYRYAGLAAAGGEDGTSWADQWLYTAVPWATLESLAASKPVYLFLDQGTYTSQLAIGGSGAGEDRRIYVMPGYAAEQMGVGGDHSGHTGQVIFDREGNGTPGISIDGRSYVTVDGYADPRPKAGNLSKLLLKNVSTTTRGMVEVVSTSGYVTLRRLEIMQDTPTVPGDGVHFNKYDSPAVSGNHVVEECYIHDLGHRVGGVNYAGVWVNYFNDCTVRYCEMDNIGWGDSNAEREGEGVGASLGHQTNIVAHHNVMSQVGRCFRSIAIARFNTLYNFIWGYTATTGMGEDLYIENNVFVEWDGGTTNSIFIQGTEMVYANANCFYDAAQEADADIHGNWYGTAADLNAEEDENMTIQDNNVAGAANYLVNPPSDCALSANATNAVNGAYVTNWEPTRDFVGALQYGASWDIGALERQS